MWDTTWTPKSRCSSAKTRLFSFCFLSSVLQYYFANWSQAQLFIHATPSERCCSKISSILTIIYRSENTNDGGLGSTHLNHTCKPPFFFQWALPVSSRGHNSPVFLPINNKYFSYHDLFLARYSMTSAVLLQHREIDERERNTQANLMSVIIVRLTNTGQLHEYTQKGAK